MQAKLGLIQ